MHRSVVIHSTQTHQTAVVFVKACFLPQFNTIRRKQSYSNALNLYDDQAHTQWRGFLVFRTTNEVFSRIFCLCSAVYHPPKPQALQPQRHNVRINSAQVNLLL